MTGPSGNTMSESGIWTDSGDDMIIHDSRDLFYRIPSGAVTNGTTVILRLKFEDEEVPAECRCNFWKKGYELEKDMLYNAETKSFECAVDAISSAEPLWYYFVYVYSDKRLYFYGNNDKLTGGIGRIYESDPKSYQITVYNRMFRTPKWWRDGTVYHIFIDRFYKSDSYTNSKPDPTSYYHENWSDKPLHKPHSGRQKYFPDDYFGGNLHGIIDKLDYISSLGIATIYLSPVFEAHSNHKYDTADYTNVDRSFGTNKTLIDLCEKAAKMGIKVILDGVFSHTGDDSIYFNKYGTYESTGAYQSPDSPYYSWYTFKKYPDSYDCWWDFPTMPTVDKSNVDFRNFINGKNGVVRSWLSRGISGWRLDVADELPMEFLRELRMSSKDEKPDSLIIGEVWEDASNKVTGNELRNYCYGDTLDSVMNYPVRTAVLDFMTGAATAAETKDSLDVLLENYPAEFQYAAMNLLGSHDRPRMRTVLSGAPDHETLTRDEQASYAPDKAESLISIDRVKCASAFLYALPGVPYLYYGDETGLTGMTDPFNRGTYPWGHENNELIDFFRFIGKFRKNNDTLINGSTRYLSPGDDVLGCLRTYEKSSVLVLINRNPVKSQHVSIGIKDSNSMKDIISGEMVYKDNDGSYNLEISRLSYRILVAP